MSLLHSLFPSTNRATSCLEVRIQQRDTILFRQLVHRTDTFRIGRSHFNPFRVETPALPMRAFELVKFHGGERGPEIQFTSTMHGVLQRGRDYLTLEELKTTPQIHPTLHGYRLTLRAHESLMLRLDGLTIHIRWTTTPENDLFTRIPLQLDRWIAPRRQLAA